METSAGMNHDSTLPTAGRVRPDSSKSDRSVTVVHLGPDHPPIVKTIYSTVPNTIALVPYASMTRDGRYGFVVSNTNGLFAPEPADCLSVIDLSSLELAVVQKVAIPSPWMAPVHPDGKHVIVSYAGGFRVFEMRGSQLVLQRDNRLNVSPLSMDISPKGDRIVAALVAADLQSVTGVHVFSYRGELSRLSSETGSGNKSRRYCGTKKSVAQSSKARRIGSKPARWCLILRAPSAMAASAPPRTCATLEDWFDPRRLRDDYVPTGWKGPLAAPKPGEGGPGTKTRAVKGHKFGLDLSADERKALIAFLKDSLIWTRTNSSPGARRH